MKTKLLSIGIAFGIAMTLLMPVSANSVEGRDYSSGIGYQSEWTCAGQGKFNWYCEEEKEEEQRAAETTKPADKQSSKQSETREEKAIKEMEAIRKNLDGKRVLSVLYPTEENIRAYIAAQKQEIDRAAFYADVWRRVLWQNAELNFELKNPMNNSAIKVMKSERNRSEQETMTALAKEWGLFFFFRGDCPYCKHMVPTLQWITRSYDMTILPISLDGATIEGLPPSVKDNGMAAKFGVEAVPLYVLGNVKTGKMVILGSGVLSLQDFVERIYVLTQTKPGEL